MDVDVEPPHVHVPGHAAPVRRHWSDYAIPGAALFVSLISIFIAWGHGQEMKKLVEANSLPYVQLYNSDVTPAGKPQFSLVLSNQGIGPAEIRTAEIIVDGKPRRTTEDVMAACCGGQPEGLGNSSLAGRMVRPGEISPYLVIPIQPSNAKIEAAMKHALRKGRLETRICFCSVFDECWTISSRRLSRPRSVGECPPVGVMYLP